MVLIGMVVLLLLLLLILAVAIGIIYIPVHLMLGAGGKAKQLGYVADFCPLCRSIRPFKLTRQEGQNLRLVSQRAEKVYLHEATCTVCHTPREVEPATYASISKDADLDLERLVRETFPEIRRVHADRVRMEKARAEGELSRGEKAGLVDETFAIFEEEVAENCRAFLQAKGPGLWILGLTILAAVAGTYLASGVSLGVARGLGENTVVLLVFGFFAGLCLSIGLMIAEPRRVLLRKILPAMARSLQPLDLSRTELEEALERSRVAGGSIGKKIRTELLWDAI